MCNNKVAIVIPTLNREKVLCDTIESVLSLNPAPDEIWVIDQTPQHEPTTEAYLEQVCSRGVNILRLPKPSVCFARNLGAALSNSDIIIYIDDDVVIRKSDFVEVHRRNYNNPEIDAVWGQILKPNQETTDKLKKPGLVPGNYADRVEKIKYIVSANHSIRRNVMLEMGGYDEGFEGRTYANEDGDLGRRLYEQGYRIDFDPTAGLIHLQAPSGGNRIIGRDSFPEWTRSVTFFQFAFRHYSGCKRIWKIIYVFRTISLRKENVIQFWYLPVDLLHAIYGMFLALKRHRRGFKSSLIFPGIDFLCRQYDNKIIKEQ
jgi:glycosyltransferase involved in cell wall biosynthesis